MLQDHTVFLQAGTKLQNVTQNLYNVFQLVPMEIKPSMQVGKKNL